MAYIRNVKSSRRHIRCDQNTNIPFLKRIDGVDTCILPLVGMNNTNLIFTIFTFQKVENIVCYLLCLTENNQSAKRFIILQEMLKQIQFCLLVGYNIQCLTHRFCWCSLFRHLNNGRKC
ncbi:hypothetical protein D3C73_970250 [compost metagenome]